MRALLSIASVVAPLAAVVAIALRPPPRPFLDTAVVGGGAGLILALRFVRAASIPTRSALAMTILFGMGVFLLTRMGLAPGVVLLFAVTSVFAALYFGRAMAFVAVALGGVAFIVVGWFVSNGYLPEPQPIAEASRYANWVRVGTVFMLIGSLLASAISFVIGRVEATADSRTRRRRSAASWRTSCTTSWARTSRASSCSSSWPRAARASPAPTRWGR
jgi:hypothetical protein